jgi:predicted nucleic acid-binding protein
MLVVADTSPLHYLVLIQQEAILPALYDRVAIPPAVVADLQQSRTPHLVRAWVVHRPVWLEVHRPREALDARQFPRLGAWEREAIAFARELQAPLLLIDDADGRAEAERQALAATGTLAFWRQPPFTGWWICLARWRGSRRRPFAPGLNCSRTCSNVMLRGSNRDSGCGNILSTRRSRGRGGMWTKSPA